MEALEREEERRNEKKEKKIQIVINNKGEIVKKKNHLLFSYAKKEKEKNYNIKRKYMPNRSTRVISRLVYI